MAKKTVKDLGEGSIRLQHLPVGTWVIAEGPYGAMTAARGLRAIENVWIPLRERQYRGV